MEYRAVSGVLAAYLEESLSVCDDLLRVLFTVCSPERPHFFSTQSISTFKPFRFADCISIDDEVIVYPRVLTSSDGVWHSLATLPGNSASEVAVYRAIYDVILTQTTGSRSPDEHFTCWRALVQVDEHLRLTVTISDLFRRSEIRHDLALSTCVEQRRKQMRLERGRLFVDEVQYALSGNFIYSFVNKVLRLSDAIHIYAEGGILMAMHLDHRRREGKVSLVDTLGFSAINTFVYAKQSVGVLLCSNDAFCIALINDNLKLKLTPVHSRKLKKFPFAACSTASTSLQVCVTLCGRADEQAHASSELLLLDPMFVNDLAIC